MSNFSDDQQYIGVDFHIHTPASSCYKGPHNDDEYLEILRRYKEKNIRILAITDHNTLKGFRKLQRIKNELLNKYIVLSDLLEKYPDVLTEYNKVKDDLDLFKKLLILPGIEFEANPGVHILLIFNPDSDLNAVEKFLIESGYTDEIQGQENNETLPKIEVINLLSEAGKLDALIIAAHADSDKGIYNCLEGKYRANVFSSDNLNAISYNNPITCQKMKQMLQNKEYKRENPIAFIQSSDYHGEGEVGKLITFLKLDELNFESIKLALKNPNECVSPTQHPKIINILNQVIHDHKTFVFKDFNSHIEDLRRTACAILNDGYGTIVIGAISNPQNIIGVKLDDKQCRDQIESLLTSIKPTKSAKTSIYPFGDKNVIITQLFSKGNSLYYLENNNEVYILQDNNIIQATPPQLERTVENRIFKRMMEHQKTVEPKLDNLIKEINLLKDLSQQVVLINKIEKGASRLLDIIDISLVGLCKNQVNISAGNGDSTGNVMFISSVEPRLLDAYLRCSCPRTNKYEIEQLNLKKFKGPAIILVPGGGTFYVELESEWSVIPDGKSSLPVIITVKKNMKHLYSELSLLGWLKSSINIWYSYNAFGDIDIYKPEILSKILVPRLETIKPEGTSEKTILQIINKEFEFLTIDVNDLPPKEYQKKVIEHNRNIDKLASRIDKALISELEISLTEMESITKFFEAKQIYLMKEVTKIVNQFEEEAACATEENL